MTPSPGPYGPAGHGAWGAAPRRRHPVDIAVAIAALSAHTLLLPLPVLIIGVGAMTLVGCGGAQVCGSETFVDLAAFCATGSVGVLWLASIGLTVFCIVRRRPGWWAALVGVLGHGGLTLVTYLLMVAAGPVS